ncbi:hypothetical protein K438DRAFT_2000771 [Mycena galopus ATCC 62051]|nr:hypothetical protein K438DRAFT_2000771 [Mycena galopus ATCC 62051]
MKLAPSRWSRKRFTSQRRISNALPAELLLEVAGHLTWAIDVLNFSLTSSHVRTILLPELYRAVFLFGGAWSGALEMLARRPDLCAHIRTLEIDLFYEAIRPERQPPQADIDIEHIATLIEKAAASGALFNLRTFEWSGRQVPPDHLLLTLRNGCPQLKNLYFYANSIRFDPASELFKFDDLTAFSLRVAYDEKASDPFAPMQEIPAELSDMLLQRCPRLESLSIRLQSVPNIWSQDPQIALLMLGVWPKLEFFHVDIEIFDSTPMLLWPSLSTLRTFLSLHTSCITDLGLSAYTIFPATFSREIPSLFDTDASAPFRLTFFEGLLQHVAALPDPAALETLVLDTVVTENSLETMLPVLRGLTSLGDLTLEFSEVDAVTVVRDIVSVLCPTLTDLHLKFYKTMFTSNQLNELSALLKPLSQLRSLIFDEVYSAIGGTLLKTALMFLANNPLLEEICIVNFQAKRWYQRGHYLVLTGTKGRRFITARECGMDRGYPQPRFAHAYPSLSSDERPHSRWGRRGCFFYGAEEGGPAPYDTI